MKVVISPRLAACKDAVYFVNSLPETFDNSGKTVFSGRNTIKVFKVEWGGKAQEVCVKRFKRPNAAQKIAYTFFRTTKAQRAFEVVSGGESGKLSYLRPFRLASYVSDLSTS